MHYTWNMKTALLPPVRVSEDLRKAAESVLIDGESLSGLRKQLRG